MSLTLLTQPLPPPQSTFPNEISRKIYEERIYASLSAHRELAERLSKRSADYKERYGKLTQHAKNLEYENERRRRQVSQLKKGERQPTASERFWARAYNAGFSGLYCAFIAMALAAMFATETTTFSILGCLIGIPLYYLVAAYGDDDFAFYLVEMMISSATAGGMAAGLMQYLTRYLVATGFVYAVVTLGVTWSMSGEYAKKKQKKTELPVNMGTGFEWRRRSSTLSPLGPGRRFS